MIPEKVEFKINSFTEYKALKSLLISTVLWFALAIFILIYLEESLIFFIVIGFYFLFYFIPTINLHHNYEHFNKNKVLIMDKEKIVLGDTEILINEIKVAKVFGTYQSINKIISSQTLPFQDKYFYIEVENVKGDKIYLTNLLSTDLIEIFKTMYPTLNIEERRIAYPSIK